MPNGRPETTQAKRDAVLSLSACGASYKQIQRATGLHLATIAAIRRDAGLLTRRNAPRQPAKRTGPATWTCRPCHCAQCQDRVVLISENGLCLKCELLARQRKEAADATPGRTG